MAAEQFLHGIEVLEVDDGIRPIPIIETAIIGLIGTAPDADPDAFPINEPVAIIGNPRQAALLDTVGENQGTLKDAIDAIFDQAGATVVIVRVEEGLDLDDTMGNIMGDATLGTACGHSCQHNRRSTFVPRCWLLPASQRSAWKKASPTW